MMNNKLFRMIFVITMVFLIGIMTGCEEEPDAPKGTLWFCILKYKLTFKNYYYVIFNRRRTA